MDARLYTEGQRCSIPAMLDFILMSQLTCFRQFSLSSLKVLVLLVHNESYVMLMCLLLVV